MKIILLIILVLIPNLILGQGTITQGQDEDIEATSVEEIPASDLTPLDSDVVKKLSSLPPHFVMSREAKPWKLEEVYKSLPKNIRDEIYDVNNVTMDRFSNLWGIGNVLYDNRSKKIIFQGVGLVVVSDGGQYFYIGGAEEDDSNLNADIYKTEPIKKIKLPDGVTFSHFIGSGRYAVVEMDGEDGIIDLENPDHVIENIDGGAWGYRGICEFENEPIILHQEQYSVSMYHLPDFTLVKNYIELGSGEPFVNGTETIIGSNNGLLCYLLNRSTGEMKSYGINRENCEDLIEGPYLHPQEKNNNDQTDNQSDLTHDVLTKRISLSNFKTLEQIDVLSSNRFVSGEPINGKSCGIHDVITPPNTSDVWLVINQVNSFDSHNHSGQSLFLRVGENLKIKQIMRLDRTINGAYWDTQTSSLVGKTFQNEYFHIKVTP